MRVYPSLLLILVVAPHTAVLANKGQYRGWRTRPPDARLVADLGPEKPKMMKPLLQHFFFPGLIDRFS